MPPDEPGLQKEPTQQKQTPAAEPKRPEWLPSKFQTPEALAESYTHLESRLGQQGNELAEARERAEQLQALIEQQREQPAPPQYQQDQDPLIAAYEHAYENGDARMMLAVQAELANRAAAAVVGAQSKPAEPEDPTDLGAITALAEQEMARRYGDEYDQLKAETAAQLADNEHLVTGPTFNEIIRGLDQGFRLAREGKLLQNQTQAQQQQAQAEKDRQAKLAAQTATGAGSRPAPKSEQEQTWERIKNAETGGFSTA